MKVNVKLIAYEDVCWIHMAQYGVHWQDVVKW